MGFWDNTTAAMRWAFYGFCGALASVVLAGLSEYLNWPALGFFSVAMMVGSIAVGFFGGVFASGRSSSDL